jgi:AcrR family transcriptional regulator
VSADRAEQVYEAALRLFREKGYHATSMQDIASQVGLYKGSLYHYIGGKEDLLVQVFERALGALLAQVEQITADEAPARVQLRRVISAHVNAVADNLDALTVYLHEWRALDGASLANVRQQRERYVSLVDGIIRRGIRAGELRAQDPRIATLAVLGMCNWLCQWYRPGGRLGPEQIGDRFADLVLDGLAATSASSRGPARPRPRQTTGSATTSTAR